MYLLISTGRGLSPENQVRNLKLDGGKWNFSGTKTLLCYVQYIRILSMRFGQLENILNILKPSRDVTRSVNRKSG